MTISLRPLDKGDLPTVRTWFEDEEARRWLGGPDWPAKSLRLVGPERHSLLAIGDNLPVAMIDLEIYADRRASFAIAVDSARRRQGLGAAVVEALLAHPILANVRELFAGVEQGNVASARLLERCGFVKVTDVDHEGFRYFARPAPARPWQMPD